MLLEILEWKNQVKLTDPKKECYSYFTEAFVSNLNNENIEQITVMENNRTI